MIDFGTFTKILFKKKKDYQYLTDKDKERLFFIFNRYMTRAFPANSDALNLKGIDGALAVDLWFNYCQKTLDIPHWFYPRTKKSKSISTGNSDLDEMDHIILNTFFTEKLQENKDEKIETGAISVKKKKTKKK